MKFVREFIAVLSDFFLYWFSLSWRELRRMNLNERAFLLGSLILTIGSCAFVAASVKTVRFNVQLPAPSDLVERPTDAPPPPPVVEVVDYSFPLRDEPPSFPLNKRWPANVETSISKAIDKVSFDPKRDLIHIDDDRVWWESDNDTGDTEDDHMLHWAMEDPFRRLVELMEQAGGKLKVQDVYRAEGVHAPKSLHKQGRAMDLTTANPDVVSLGRLAKLCVASGFDWVYFEAKGGLHIHASITPEGKVRRTWPKKNTPSEPTKTP
ncbi:MAG: hypothetical protein ACI9TH_001667 [Kiritimatiellia bacterium]|jgi:hypothetical protein